MTAITAFIFDLDGVITDTSELHFQSWQRMADEEGLPFTREDNEALRGVSRRQSLEFLLKGAVFPEDKMQDMMTRKNDYYQDLLQSLSGDNLLPGVSDFLADAKVQGLKMGIGSASRNAKSVVNILGIGEMFGVIGDGYSVVNPKPSPDLFIWVAGGLGVNVQHAIVFEDAEAGVDAAKAAGMRSVGIGTANVRHADHMIPSLHTTSVTQILKYFDGA